jgi:hypothetical protein
MSDTTGTAVTAFLPQSKTVCIVTSGTGSTATSTSIAIEVAGQVRIRGAFGNTADIFLSITQNADTATIPVAGTPSPEWPLAPNSVEVLSYLGVGTISVNTISTAASQTLYLTFGGGL